MIEILRGPSFNIFVLAVLWIPSPSKILHESQRGFPSLYERWKWESAWCGSATVIPNLDPEEEEAVRGEWPVILIKLQCIEAQLMIFLEDCGLRYVKSSDVFAVFLEAVHIPLCL